MNREQDDRREDWKQIDARILGQILAAQNILFVLPDEKRIAEFFSEVLDGVPGVSSCFFCFGNRPLPVQEASAACTECLGLREIRGEPLALPPDFRCGLAAREGLRAITLGTIEHTFGFLLLEVDPAGTFELYWPFLNNLASYIALSLENRLRKRMLEKARDELEDKVRERTGELRASEDRYRRITEGLTDYQYSVRVQDGLPADTRQGAACEKVTGYTTEEFAADPDLWVRCVLPEDRELVRRRVQLILAGGDAPPLEHRITRKDGEVRWVCDTTILLKDASGRLLSYDGVIKDVTERRQAEEQLRKLSMAVDQSPVSVIMTTAAGEIEYVNPKFTSITGYSLEEVRGKNPRILKSGETAPEVYRQLWEAIAAGRLWQGELRNRKKNGELFWESAAISAVRDQEGTITHFIAIKEDITERKYAEEELKRSEMKQRELERELVQAQKLESLGTLASGIAHDFNNILAIIVGQSSLLKISVADPARMQHRIEAIGKASERGATLVRQLLTFARKSEPTFSSLSINTVINEVVVLLRETLPKTITVLTSLQEDIPPVTADVTQIHQVLFNLVLNARDAMPTGGTITIATTTAGFASIVSRFPRAARSDYVRIDVTDTGMGMSDDTKQRIFDPFFTTKSPGKGTGLGLALAYSIIESHRGMIGVESVPGKGATFSVYLPVNDHPAETGRPAAGLLAEIPGGSETILLIEDEEMLTEMVTEILAAKGYRVLSASDGEAGVALFSRRWKEISVVLSDLGLPKLGGEEVFRRIRGIDPNARVVMASGFIDPEVRAGLLKNGVRGFVQKPYQPSDVLRALRTILDGAQ